MNTKVLLVDDEHKVLQALQRRMGRRYPFHIAESGQKGLKIMEEHGPFAVIISDYKMPGMDGIEFLTKVQERNPATLRIMLTGYPAMSTAVRAVSKGKIFFFLTKPSTAEWMSRIIDQALNMYNDNLHDTAQDSAGVMSKKPEDIFCQGVTITLDHLQKDDSEERLRAKVEQLSSEGLLLRVLGNAEIHRKLPEGKAIRLACKQGQQILVSPVIIKRHQYYQDCAEGKSWLLLTSYPQHIQVMPRRRFYRIEVDISATVEGETYRVINLSGNGMLICVDREDTMLLEGEMKKVMLHLESQTEPITFMARIVRIEPSSVANNKRNVALHFPNITRTQRETIIRYIFKKQHEQIQKKTVYRTKLLDRKGL